MPSHRWNRADPKIGLQGYRKLSVDQLFAIVEAGRNVRDEVEGEIGEKDQRHEDQRQGQWPQPGFRQPADPGVEGGGPFEGKAEQRAEAGSMVMTGCRRQSERLAISRG